MNREDQRAARRDARRAQKVEGTATPVKAGRTGPAQFLKEVRQELRKVNWPSRSQVISYTSVVLVVTAVLTTLIWGVDWVISNAVLNVFGG
ncbi:MAG: preprotein translocase subunit SecE [Nitriliruptoraceae bacterium]|jgi:preprotein translocase subunit SecE